MIWYIIGVILNFLILFGIFTLTVLENNKQNIALPLANPIDGVVLFLMITIASIGWPAFQLFILLFLFSEISKANAANGK